MRFPSDKSTGAEIIHFEHLNLRIYLTRCAIGDNFALGDQRDPVCKFRHFLSGMAGHPVLY